MTPPSLLEALVVLLHDLFTVLWLGGIATMLLVVMPAMREARRAATGPAAAGPGPGGPLAELAATIQRRLGPVALVSFAGLAVTGALLARRAGSTGLFRFDSVYAALLSVKHVLVLAMLAVMLARRRLLAGGPTRGLWLLPVNAALGVAVLALSAIGSVLGGP